VKAAAFAAFIRVFAVAFAGRTSTGACVLWWLAVLTMFGANLIALTQGSVKRMLAYSSIAHAGYLLVAVLAANAYGAAAFLFYLLVYTLMTAGAFGVVIANARGQTSGSRWRTTPGFGWQQPLLGAIFAVFLLSLAGFPLTAGSSASCTSCAPALEAGSTCARGDPGAGVADLVLLLPARDDRDVHAARRRRRMRRDRGLSSPARRFAVAPAVAVLALFFVPGWVLDAAQRSVASLFTAPGAFFGLGP
jgi:hypothetical protein